MTIIYIPSMTNIVHFAKFYFPDTGGIESVTSSLAKGAVKAGHTVTVVCFKKIPSLKQEVIEGVTVIRAPVTKLFASQPLGFKYFLQCLTVARGADVIHLHTPNMLGALCALFIPVRTRLLVHWHSDVINKGLLGKMLRPLESALLRRADCIVATSQVYANSSKSLLPFKHKTAVVPIGVPDVKREIDSSDLPTALSERIGNRKFVLAVGRLVPYKGFDILIQAARKLTNNSVVVIVGGGPLREKLQKIIEFNKVEDRVFLTGRLSDRSLHTLFERATLYCLPSTSRAEAFGVVLLEAMAYGLPIVASEIPGSGVPWVNCHNLSGLNVPVKDIDSLARACNQILDCADLQTKFSQGARQRFLADFTEDLSVTRMMAIYDDLVSDQ